MGQGIKTCLQLKAKIKGNLLQHPTYWALHYTVYLLIPHPYNTAVHLKKIVPIIKLRKQYVQIFRDLPMSQSHVTIGGFVMEQNSIWVQALCLDGCCFYDDLSSSRKRASCLLRFSICEAKGLDYVGSPYHSTAQVLWFYVWLRYHYRNSFEHMLILYYLLWGIQDQFLRNLDKPEGIEEVCSWCWVSPQSAPHLNQGLKWLK